MQQTPEQREAHNAKRREQRSQQTPEKREVQNINRCIDYQSFPQTQIQARLRAHLSRVRQRPKRLFPYDIKSPGIPESPVLTDFECNVDSAAALLWERSGIYRFRDLFYKCDEASVIHPEIKCELEAHNINSEILERCINGYNNYMSPFEIDICYCAVCNIRTFEHKEHCAMSVESLPSILLLSEEASNMFYSTPHNFRSAFNVFQHAGHLYFLNPSLLFTDICGNQKFPICEQCNIALYSKKKIPTYSIANGFDFGDAQRIGLPKLTLLEKAVLSRCHLYAQIIKLVPPRGYNKDTHHVALKGHVLVLDHDGPEQLSKSLINLDVRDFVSVSFVGTLAQWDVVKLTWRKLSTLQDLLLVNVDSIQKWLHAFHYLKNPQYADINCYDLDASQIDYILKLPQTIIDNADIIDDEIAGSVERHSGSSSANILPDSDAVDNGRNNLDFVRVKNRFNKVPDNTNINLTAIRNAFPNQIRNVTISRSSVPNNEFIHNDRILLRTFPWLFLFGKIIILQIDN